MKTQKARRKTARKTAKHKHKIHKAKRRVGGALKKKKNGRLTST